MLPMNPEVLVSSKAAGPVRKAGGLANSIREAASASLERWAQPLAKVARANTKPRRETEVILCAVRNEGSAQSHKRERYASVRRFPRAEDGVPKWLLLSSVRPVGQTPGGLTTRRRTSNRLRFFLDQFAAGAAQELLDEVGG